jgi:hypothetical protein
MRKVLKLPLKTIDVCCGDYKESFRFIVLTMLLSVLVSCGSTPTSIEQPVNSQTPATTSAAIEASKATEEPEPQAIPALDSGISRSNPLALGYEVCLEHWSITILSAIRGDEAAAAIQQANQFNEPAPDGYEYILATIKLVNISTKQEAQPAGFAADIRLTGDRNVLYSPASVTTPKELTGDLFPGDETQGQIAFLVPNDETKLMFSVDETFIRNAGTRRFVGLDQGAILPSPELMYINPTDAGTQRNAPIPFGETAIADEWEITILETLRGDAAATLVQAANQFNEPLVEGIEYIAIKARLRYLGSGRSDYAEQVMGGEFKIIGEQNKIYDRVSVVAPEPALQGFVFAGGVLEGWDIFAVSAGEQKLALVFEPIFAFSTDNLRFLAIE